MIRLYQKTTAIRAIAPHEMVFYSDMPNIWHIK